MNNLMDTVFLTPEMCNLRNIPLQSQGTITVLTNDCIEVTVPNLVFSTTYPGGILRWITTANTTYGAGDVITWVTDVTDITQFSQWFSNNAWVVV